MLTAKLQPHYEGLDSSMMSLKMPHDVSIEQTVIGALMLDKSAFKICNRVLTSKECFYKPIHQSIFDAIKKLDNKSAPIDMVTVVDQLKKDGLIGRENLEGTSRKIKRLNQMRERFGVTPTEIVECTNRVASSANIEYHSRILYQLYMRRELIATSYENITKASDSTNDVFELYEKTAKSLRAKNPQNVLTLKTMNDTMVAGAKEPPALRLAGTLFHENSVAIVFSDPGTGKTIFSTQVADCVSRGTNLFGRDDFHNNAHPKKTILFDFEMEESEMYHRYKKKKIDAYKWHKNFYRCGINPNFIDFEDADTLITNEIEVVIEDEEPDFVIIDNITFISSESSDPKMATKLMKKLTAIQKRSRNNLTLVVIAHTPKRDPSLPIELRHLAGAKSLSNFAKTVIAISKSKLDPSFRYIKQLKIRQDQELYNEDNVLVCNINKNLNSGRLEYEFREFGKESDHLVTPDAHELEFEIIHECIELQKLNKSLRELADHVKVEYGVSMSHTTIGKKIAKYKENMLPELEPLKQKNDTFSKAKGNTKNQTTTTAKNTK